MFYWLKKMVCSGNNQKAPYQCSQCGEQHNEWPALTFQSPSSYDELTKEEQSSIANIDLDFCTITYEEQIDRFIRVVLIQEVIDSDQNLHYGLWVSLSEKSYNDYLTNFNNKNHEEQYFGWLNSRIPGYNNTLNIPMTVLTKKGNERPEIFPHKDHPHSFVEDYYSGISRQEAEKRIHKMMNNS